MFDCIIFTCEHGGNKIPGKYKRIFSGQDEILKSHRGWDPGALELAEFLSGQFNAPLFYTETCRLIVEANRSIGYHDFFSEFTSGLPDDEKQQLIETYYLPYRRQVEAFLEQLIYSDKNVLHISVHSCTPVLNGVERKMDLSFLFDPKRNSEKQFCEAWRSEINKANHDLLVRFNYPYLGTDDGFTTHLRQLFPDENYAGIELEINQKYPLEQTEKWKELQQLLLHTLQNADILKNK